MTMRTIPNHGNGTLQDAARVVEHGIPQTLTDCAPLDHALLALLLLHSVILEGAVGRDKLAHGGAELNHPNEKYKPHEGHGPESPILCGGYELTAEASKLCAIHVNAILL